MCNLKRLDCKVCNVGGKYLMFPCEDFLKDHGPLQTDTNGGVSRYSQTTLPIGKRFYCPELVWPPAPESEVRDTMEQVCNACISDGIQYYEESRCIGRQDEDANEPWDNDDFPEYWSEVSPTWKHHVFKTYFKTTEAVRTQRFFLLGCCKLVIWVPCCRLCEEPSLNIENVDSVDRVNGVNGAEFEPNSTLWALFYQIQDEDAGIGIETSVATGTLFKPCRACTNLELRLRDQIVAFLETCEAFEAWIVWSWLRTRAMPDVDFFNHEAYNYGGFPDTQPKHVDEYMKVMATTWSQRTGVEWEHFVDFPYPTACVLPLIMHEEVFNNLKKWNRIVARVSRDEFEARSINFGPKEAPPPLQQPIPITSERLTRHQANAVKYNKNWRADPRIDEPETWAYYVNGPRPFQHFKGACIKNDTAVRVGKACDGQIVVPFDSSLSDQTLATRPATLIMLQGCGAQLNGGHSAGETNPDVSASKGKDTAKATTEIDLTNSQRNGQTNGHIEFDDNDSIDGDDLFGDKAVAEALAIQARQDNAASGDCGGARDSSVAPAQKNVSTHEAAAEILEDATFTQCERGCYHLNSRINKLEKFRLPIGVTRQ